MLSDALKLQSAALLRYLDQNAIGLLDAVPSYLRAVLAEVAPARLPNALRYLLIGGEPLDAALLQAVKAQLGEQIRVVNIYGLTELTDINALAPLAVAHPQPITVGRALRETRGPRIDVAAPQPKGETTTARRASIAVMPFVDASGAEGRVADGLT